MVSCGALEPIPEKVKAENDVQGEMNSKILASGIETVFFASLQLQVIRQSDCEEIAIDQCLKSFRNSKFTIRRGRKAMTQRIMLCLSSY